jgi:hypothetical protein
MSDYETDDEIIQVENSNSKQKHISLKNIEPVKGIKIIRSESPSISSEDSDLSSISEKKVKKTKKVLRKKEKQSVPQTSQNYNFNCNNNYSAFSNPKNVREYVQSEMSESSY